MKYVNEKTILKDEICYVQETHFRHSQNQDMYTQRQCMQGIFGREKDSSTIISDLDAQPRNSTAFSRIFPLLSTPALEILLFAMVPASAAMSSLTELERGSFDCMFPAAAVTPATSNSSKSCLQISIFSLAELNMHSPGGRAAQMTVFVVNWVTNKDQILVLI
jgi:hypothetical protein